MKLKELQPPLTVEQQIENLRTLDLIIDDDEQAKEILNDISYFRLIKAYSLGLKPKNGNYYNGVSFDQIVQLYKFNCNFRQLLLPIIERVEINLRCRIANYFSYKYDVLGYMNPDNFANIDYHMEFMEDLQLEIERNKRAPFVRNFQEHYKEATIPMYAAVELFSFGTLSKFFKNMKNEDKKAVAKTYDIGYTYLESWIESIAYVRNLCAHYGRLYNAKLTKTPTLYKQYSASGIGNIRIFGVLICFYHLIPHDIHWDDFVDQLGLLIEKYPAVKINTMGFPDEWKSILTPKSHDKILQCQN